MELSELLNPRIVIDLNNFKLKRKAQEQDIQVERPISSVQLMGGQQTYRKVKGRVRSMNLRLVA